MSNESKPEWFQLADADRVAHPQEVKSPKKRSARALAFSAPVMVLGAGLLFTQSHALPNASAKSAISSPATSSTSSTALILPAKAPSIANVDAELDD
jgi:hypothetical protein